MGRDYESGLPQGDGSQAESRGVCVCVCVCVSLVTLTVGCGGCVLQVWPYLLGLYPVDCSDEEKTSINKQCEKQYDTVLSNWKHAEELQKEIEALMPQRLSPGGLLLMDRTRNGAPEPATVAQNGNSHTESDQRSPRGHTSVEFEFKSPTIQISERTSSPVNSDGSRSSSPCSHTLSDLSSSGNSSPDLQHKGGGAGGGAGWVGAHQSQAKPQSSSVPNGSLANGEAGHPARGDPENPPKCLDHEEELLQLGLLVPPQRLARNGHLSDSESVFLEELVKIDKDIPRCDRDYW